MALDAACAVLKVDKDYARETVLAAFRREAKKAHPDVGGTAEQCSQQLLSAEVVETAGGAKSR